MKNKTLNTPRPRFEIAAKEVEMNVPGNSDIICSVRIQVNGGSPFFGRRRLFLLVFFFAFANVFVVGCGSERKAERMYEQAEAHVEANEVDAAVSLLEELIHRYPTTAAARRAESQLPLYRGLISAEKSFAARTARDLMVTTARAIQRYRDRRRRWPETLDRLRPQLLGTAPIDPWGRPLIYEPKSNNRGYVLACYGADGQPGGSGDAADWFVRNGRFVTDPAIGAR